MIFAGMHLCYSSPPGLGISKAESEACLEGGGLLSLCGIDRVFGNLLKEVFEPIEAGRLSFRFRTSDNSAGATVT